MTVPELEIHKKTDQINSFEYENAVILPRITGVRAEEPMWGLGGVCNQEGNFVDSSAYDGGWATHGGPYLWNEEEEEYLEEEVIYFGMFFKHWGHFLVDLIGRMWYPVCSAKYSQNMKVAYLGEEKPDQNHLEFFQLLGINEKQLIHVTKPMRCRKVIVPEIAFRSCMWYTEEALQMFRYIINHVSKNEDLHKKYGKVKKIYFSRTQFGKAQNSEFGEEMLEYIFEQNGYTSIAPEKLSLSEQVYLWNHAENIACVNGTIPLNVAFCANKNLKLTVLNKTSLFHGNPYLFLEMQKVKARFVDVYKEPFKKYPKSLGEGPFLVTITKAFVLWMEEEGMRLPYRAREIQIRTVKNQIKYCFSILGITRKIRMLLSKMCPDKMKQIARKIRGIH